MWLWGLGLPWLRYVIKVRNWNLKEVRDDLREVMRRIEMDSY